MATVRREVELEPELEAKLERLSRVSGRPEAEIIREALQALPDPEDRDSVISTLKAAGLIVERTGLKVSREEARATYERYLAQVAGRGPFGFTQAVLDERKEGH